MWRRELSLLHTADRVCKVPPARDGRGRWECGSSFVLLVEVDSNWFASPEEERFVLAAGKLDRKVFVDFAFDPVGCGADVVDAGNDFLGGLRGEGQQFAAQVPVIVHADGAIAGQLHAGD